MTYNIIEDCSPYYIRYTHTNIQSIIDYCNVLTPNINKLSEDFTHYKLHPDESKKMLNMIPLKVPILDIDRVSLFISKPHVTYRAHKDGSFDHVSINYTSKILDDKCVTSWYSDEDLSMYEIDPKLRGSRECIGFDRTRHTPLKTMIAKQNECILFNTEIFHDWDNSKSDNERIVLTLRPALALRPKIYFETIKKLMFGF